MSQINDYQQEAEEQPQDPNSFQDYAAIYYEARQAKAEADSSGIKPNRVKARAALEGMNAAELMRSKRDALLALLDAELMPPAKRILGMWIENRRAIEECRERRERILWALVGELALELSKFNCDRQAVEINADFLQEMRGMQGRYAEFRAFFLEHFPRHISQNETTNRDLFSLAMEVMLSLKGGS